ncbi:unnamed protein product [Chrysodeixis includens]|uniref:Uncharacterized protein n=1 Tax=Chrysodeixis includens TaxID=689277 RepID=A0A9N8KWV5_CHRIL|nr:unnamed protein product [Chrysodeixis includens]
MVMETTHGAYFHEMLYKRVRPDLIMTCSRHVFIPYGGNRFSRWRTRALQTTTTTIQAGQQNIVDTEETAISTSAESALLKSLENLRIRPDRPKGGPHHGRGQQNTSCRQECGSNPRAREGAAPRSNIKKLLRSSTITMVKNGPKSSISSVQSLMYQQGPDTIMRTGEATVTRDMRVPPAFRTSVVTGTSQQTWQVPAGPRSGRSSQASRH